MIFERKWAWYGIIPANAKQDNALQTHLDYCPAYTQSRYGSVCFLIDKEWLLETLRKHTLVSWGTAEFGAERAHRIEMCIHFRS
mgnify:FL=1